MDGIRYSAAAFPPLVRALACCPRPTESESWLPNRPPNEQPPPTSGKAWKASCFVRKCDCCPLSRPTQGSATREERVANGSARLFL